MSCLVGRLVCLFGSVFVCMDLAYRLVWLVGLFLCLFIGLSVCLLFLRLCSLPRSTGRAKPKEPHDRDGDLGEASPPGSTKTPTGSMMSRSCPGGGGGGDPPRQRPRRGALQQERRRDGKRERERGDEMR